mgnify:CR=1 FL=1
MYFKRKVYNELLEWKKTYSDKYAVLLEGARRVGKSTIAENFAMVDHTVVPRDGGVLCCRDI